MAQTVEYKLGEICKWSQRTPYQFRYVDVFVVHRSKTIQHQVLSLPEPDARALVAAMKTVNTQESSSANTEGSN